MRLFVRRTHIILFLPVLLLAACQSAARQVVPTLLPSTAQASAQPTLTVFVTNTSAPYKTPIVEESPEVILAPTPVQTATSTILGPTAFPPEINPLTGLPVGDIDLLQRRPVFVQISNFPREGRPQAGLSSADLVFDYYIGEGTDRFTAVFYGQDVTKAGPVRSARLVDAQIVRMYQGILAFVSADPQTVYPIILRSLGNHAINSAPITCPALCDDGRHTVLSVFTDTARLTDYATRKIKISMQHSTLAGGMAFDSRQPQSGLEGNQVLVTFNAFNQGLWRYDPTTKRYLRWSESVGANNTVSMQPLMDSNTSQQLAFDNVVILFAPYQEFAPTLHDITIWYNQYGRRAVLFRDDKALEARWFSPSTDRPIVFSAPDGKTPLAFKPGNTWIVIAGNRSSLKEVSPGQWELSFSLP
jgi:hypothetical protein